MKKLLVLSLAATIFSFAANAQTERAQKQGSIENRQNGKKGKAEFAKELNLSQEQKVQLKAHHQEMKAKKEALKAQDNITVKEMKERQAALRAEQKNKMASILNKDQIAKMETMKREKMEQKGNRKRMKQNKMI